MILGPEFRSTGAWAGRVGSFHLVVLDARRHRLEVWQRGVRRRSFARSAAAIEAVVATNGPMMGKRSRSGRQVDRMTLARSAVAGALTAAGLAWVTTPRCGRPIRSAAAGAAAGLGALVVLARGFDGWQVCGRVCSAAIGVTDLSDFENEGPSFAWIGRRAEDMPPEVGYGQLPDDVTEGLGGLLPLIVEGRAVLPGRGDPWSANVARLGNKRGVAAWAVCPTTRDRPALLIVAASAEATAIEAGACLLELGARGAVAADQRGCALLVVGGRCVVGPPRLARQLIQRYGLRATPHGGRHPWVSNPEPAD